MLRFGFNQQSEKQFNFMRGCQIGETLLHILNVYSKQYVLLVFDLLAIVFPHFQRISCFLKILTILQFFFSLFQFLFFEHTKNNSFSCDKCPCSINSDEQITFCRQKIISFSTDKKNLEISVLCFMIFSKLRNQFERTWKYFLTFLKN